MYLVKKLLIYVSIYFSIPTHTPPMQPLKCARSRGVGGALRFCVCFRIVGKCKMRKVPHWIFRNVFRLQISLPCARNPGTCRRARPFTPCPCNPLRARTRGVWVVRCVFVFFRIFGNATCDMSDIMVLSWFLVWSEPRHLQASASHPPPAHATP